MSTVLEVLMTSVQASTSCSCELVGAAPVTLYQPNAFLLSARRCSTVKVSAQAGVNVSGVMAASENALMASPRDANSGFKPVLPIGMTVPLGCVSALASRADAHVITNV